MALILWIWAGAVAAITAVAVVRRARTRPCAAPATRPVVLVRPCAGDEPGLEARLLSVAAARGTRPIVRISVARAEDVAASMVSAAERLRGLAFDALVVVAATEAPNRKCGQLAHVASSFPGAILVGADADVDLTGFDLDALLGPLEGDAGAAWVPPVEARGRTWGDRASEAWLGGSLHAFPLLAGLDRGGMVGKLFAVRLDRFPGGFAALAHHIGEDMALADAVRRGGWQVVATHAVIRATPAARTVAAALERYTRWVAVIRTQRPALLASYPLLFAATAPLVLSSLLAGAPAVAAFATLVRLATSIAARRASGLPLRPLDPLLDMVLGDALLWAAFVRAARGGPVTWRGRVIEATRAG